MKSLCCCCPSRVSPEDEESADEDALSIMEEIIDDVATTLKVLNDEDKGKGALKKKRTFKSVAQLVRSGAVAAKKRSTVQKKITLKSVAKTANMGAATTGRNRRQEKRSQTKKSAMNSLFKVIRLGGPTQPPQRALSIKRKKGFKSVGRLAGTMNAPHRKCSKKEKAVGLKLISRITRFGGGQDEDEEPCTCCQDLGDEVAEQPNKNLWATKLKGGKFKKP